MRGLALIALALALAGCQSYSVVQTNVFANDDGDVTKVEYGRSEKEHINYFVSPATGKRMEFRSKLVIRVTAPSLDRYTAWQCMNFNAMGTMYMTDDEEWRFMVSGFTFAAYHRQDDGRYLELFRGVLCESPKEGD